VTRVLLLSQFFPPETFAGANRVGSMADVLARDHDVVVVTPRPSYPHPSLYDLGTAFDRDRRRPYRVVRSRAFVPHSRSLTIRAVREHLMALELAARAAREPAEVVVTSSPSMFLGPVCLLLARFKSSRFVWDIRDIGWDYAGESRLISRWTRPVLWGVRRYMWWVVRRADLVVAASGGGADRLRSRAGPATAVMLVENAVARDLLEACGACRERVPKPRPMVTYVGLLGEPQAVEVLADVAGRLPAVDFTVVGEGPARGRLESRIRELGVANVTLTGYLSRTEVLDVYRRSDILFAQLKDAPTLNATSLPSKLYEYMATGKPVVYAGGGIAADAVRRADCGITVAPEAASAIADAVDELLSDTARMDQMGRNGRSFVEATADRETAFEGLAAVLRSPP